MKSFKMKITETIPLIEIEIKRFKDKIEAYKKRSAYSEYGYYNTKESGALKRAALDLKNELTKLTTSTSY